MTYQWLILLAVLLNGANIEGPYTCGLAVNGTDNEGFKKVQVRESLLFTHTAEALKEYLNDRELLMCYSSTARIKDQNYLVLRVNMMNHKIADMYGMIELGSPVRVELLNGDRAFLETVNTEVRSADVGIDHIILCKIGKDDERTLLEGNVDKIGLLWNSGFEDYPIYNVDLIKDQYECLTKHI